MWGATQKPWQVCPDPGGLDRAGVEEAGGSGRRRWLFHKASEAAAGARGLRGGRPTDTAKGA